MDKCDDDATCRICFKKPDTVYSLFNKRKGISPCDTLNKIGVRAEINDAGPPCICCNCLRELEITVSFLEKCQKSNQTIQEKFSRGLDFGEETESYKDNNNVILTENTVVEDIQDENVVTNSKEEEPPPAIHTCPHCKKMFTRKFNLKLHLKRHNREIEWSCTRCGAITLSRWLAARHCAPRPRRLCPVPGCEKTYTTNTNLKIHLRGHNGEKPFQCNDCDKKFSSKNTLQNHIRIHTGVLPYICPVCGKRFRTNKLSAHMTSHGAERHACPRAGCAKRFATRSALLRHARAHAAGGLGPAGAVSATGGAEPGPAGAGRPAVPQHACSLCTAKYHHKQSLKKHMRKQHAQTSPAEVPSEIPNEIECDD